MKKYSILFCLFLQLAMAFAQAPEKMSYQAVVRNNNNVLVSNHTVGMRISILQGSATGTAVYTETQTPTTNANGLIAIEIGTGTVVTGIFANIDWANGPYFVKTETDPNGGTAYTLTASNQLLSVPYALYAKTAGNGSSLPSGAQQGQSLTMCDGQLVWTSGGGCPAKISSFNCADTVHTNSIYVNLNNTVTSTIGYTGGNGGVYPSQNISSTGVTGLTATFAAGSLSNGNGMLSFSITGTPTTTGIASFSLNFGGKTCSFYRNVLSLPLNCSDTVHTGNLYANIQANSVTTSIGYTGGNGGVCLSQTIASTGVTGLTAQLGNAILNNGNGKLILVITGTPNGIGTANFTFNISGKTCTFTRSVIALPPFVNSLYTSSGIVGDFYKSTLINGSVATLNYYGGNGVAYQAKSFNSIGVSGIVASYDGGILNNSGQGSFSLKFSGTPTDTGIAYFTINFCSQNIVLSKYVDAEYGTFKTGTVHCNGTPTQVVEVVSPNTGRTWMDRNLGASRAAINSYDTLASGDLYQWGRGADGHQCRNSPTTIATSSSDQPGHNKFILNTSNPYDWRVPQNYNLWQEGTKINNPCPIGFRLPSFDEYSLEQNSKEFLKISEVRFDRYSQSFYIGNVPFWTSIFCNECYSDQNGNSLNNSTSVDFYNNFFNKNPYSSRVEGKYVRCIKSQVVGQMTLATDSIQIIGNLSQGIDLNNVTVKVPYTNGNGGVFGEKNIVAVNNSGVTAKLQAGALNYGNGQLTFLISGKATSSGMTLFRFNFDGGSNYEFYLNVNPAPIATINSISIDTTLNSGDFIKGLSNDFYNNLATSTVKYNGGNAGTFDGFNISSTGVTGLTASIDAGLLNIGSGSILIKFSGTPSDSGIAYFNFNLGGKNCQFSRRVLGIGVFRTGTVHCNGLPTAIVNITNPITGKTWMDRNLGASRAATSSTDSLAYGDLYQWGRGADGHQCRNSGTTSTLSSTDQPTHANFIVAPNGPNDWRTPQNDNLWQGVNGVNNPCPTGYRLPTYTELEAERTSWSQNNNIGAFGSPLKLPMAGCRYHDNGSLDILGSIGYYWSSTVAGTDPWNLRFYSGSAVMNYFSSRANGFSVRCIKD